MEQARHIIEVNPAVVQELDALIDETERRIRLKAFDRFRPHFYQRQFIDATWDHAISAWFGGNGLGKTQTAVFTALCYLRGYRPYDGKRLFEPPVHVGLWGPDFQKFHSNMTIPMILKLMPREMWDFKYNNDRVEREFILKENGSRLSLFSYQQHYNRSTGEQSPFEGIDVKVAILDEPFEEEILPSVTRGVMKQNGKIIVTCTPLTQPWMYEKFSIAARTSKDHYYQQNEIWDAVKSEKNPNGHLTKEWVMRYLDDQPPDQRQAREKGIPVHLTGVVYKEYHREYHRFDPDAVEIGEDWPKGMVVDPHDSRPFAMGWWAVAPDDCIYIFEEWPIEKFHEYRSTSMDWDSHLEVIRNIESEIPGGPDSVVWRVIDPNFGVQRKAAVGETLTDYFARHGLYFHSNVDDRIRETGHAAVHRLLRYDATKQVSADNRPRLKISTRCRNFDYAMTHYSWQRTKLGIERPGESAKDFADLLRYMAVFDPHYASVGGDSGQLVRSGSDFRGSWMG